MAHQLRTRLNVVILVAAFLLVATAWFLLEPSATSNQVPVMRVVDGDTIVVGTKTGEEKVRVIGIDTPELRDRECYAVEAKQFAARMLGGEWVVLRSDPGVPDRDRYGRLLRYVQVGRADYGQQAIDTGMAVEMTVSGQHYQRRIAYRTSTLEAQRAGTGRWGVC